MKFHFKKSWYRVKSRFKEWKGAEGGHSLSRDFTVQFLHSRGELIESPVKRPENQILPAGESFIVQVTQVDPSSSGSFHVIALSKSLPNRTGAGKPEKNPDLENLNRAMNRFYAVNYIPKAETFHPDSVMAFRGQGYQSIRSTRIVWDLNSNSLPFWDFKFQSIPNPTAVLINSKYQVHCYMYKIFTVDLLFPQFSSFC